MINGRVTALLLVSDKRTADLIKQQVHKSARSAVTITAFNIQEFTQKLSWLPATFIIVEKNVRIAAVKEILSKTYGRQMPLVITSANSRSLSNLPLQLKIVYDNTHESRSRQEVRRLTALLNQKRINLKFSRSR